MLTLTFLVFLAKDSTTIDKWNIACHISIQRISQSSAITALMSAGEFWGNTGRKEYLPSSNPQAAATLCDEPWGSSGWESTGHWPQRAEEHIKKKDFTEPKPLNLPIHRKVLNSLTWDIWFSLIHKKYFWCSDYLSFVANYITWLLPCLLKSVLSGLLDMLSLRFEVLKIMTK